MPTFERCQSCVGKGRPSDECPIVPEHGSCDACAKSEASFKILSSVIAQGYTVLCEICHKPDDGGCLMADGTWQCRACLWETDPP